MFTWRGKEISTNGDVFDAMWSCSTTQDAQEFLAAYEKVEPNARENVAFLCGYAGNAQRARLNSLFNTTHPILGTVDDPRGAFLIGQALADPKEG